MSSYARTLFVAALLLLLGQGVATAHMPWQSTVNLVVRPTGIDVQILMARDSANVLLGKGNETVALDRDNFPEHVNELAALGPGLVTLTQSDGRTLNSDAATTSLTPEDDVSFSMHYPLPTDLSGPVKVRGNYLSKLDLNHVGDISVLNANGDPIAKGMFRDQSVDFEFRLPTVSSPQSAATQMTSDAAANTKQWVFWLIFGGMIVVFATIASKSIRQSKRPIS